MAGAITTGRKKRRLAAEINVVPYIDVMLVLLIIFMVTAPIITATVDVDLPQTDSTNQAEIDEEPIQLTIKRDGSMYMDVGAKRYDQALSDQEVLDIVSAVVANKPNASFNIYADRNVVFDAALNAMNLLREAGVESASFASDPKDNSAP